MKRVPLGKGLFALVDDDDYEKVSQWKWSIHGREKHRYAARHPYINGKQILVLMHRVIMRPPKNKVVDHINGNGLDNQKANLRICKQGENSRNCRISTKNKTGYKGVYWQESIKKWRARIRFDRRLISLGSYETKEEAAKAYNKAATEYFGRFASLNTI